MHLALAATIGLPKNKQTDKNYTKNQLLGTSGNNSPVSNYVHYIYNYFLKKKEVAKKVLCLILHWFQGILFQAL